MAALISLVVRGGLSDPTQLTACTYLSAWSDQSISATLVQKYLGSKASSDVVPAGEARTLPQYLEAAGAPATGICANAEKSKSTMVSSIGFPMFNDGRSVALVRVERYGYCFNKASGEKILTGTGGASVLVFTRKAAWALANAEVLYHRDGPACVN